MKWIPTGAIAPGALRATRLQLHYAALVLASGAHSLLEHAPDDSHSNLGFDRERRSLHTRPLSGAGDAVLHLELPSFALALRQGADEFARTPLTGQTLRAAMDWVAAELAARQGAPVAITQREFPDFPDSALMAGGAFGAPPAAELEELATWFANGLELLETLRNDHADLAPCRVWPHHFDLGTLLPIEGERMIGLGLSPGDEHHDEPYFYCSPYPQPVAGADLPSLSTGTWQTEGFVSALLTASVLQERGDQGAAAAEYLAAAVAACRALVG